MTKIDPQKNNFQMIGELSTYFRVDDLDNDKFLIEIKGERKFKNIWLVKLNQLETNLEEIEYYNQLSNE